MRWTRPDRHGLLSNDIVAGCSAFDRDSARFLRCAMALAARHTAIGDICRGSISSNGGRHVSDAPRVYHASAVCRIDYAQRRLARRVHLRTLQGDLTWNFRSGPRME